MSLAFFGQLFALGLAAVAAFLFLSLPLASELGYRLGRRAATVKGTKSEDIAATSTLTAGIIGLLAFTLGLSISDAQNRFEARRDLVQVKANAIGTAWLRANLVDDAEGIAIAGKIEDYARVRLAFTTAISEANVPALVAQTIALQADIWRDTQMIARRAPIPITAETLACAARNLDCVDIQDSGSAANVIYPPCSRGVLNDWGSADIKRSSMGADGASFAGQEQRSRQDRCGQPAVY